MHRIRSTVLYSEFTDVLGICNRDESIQFRPTTTDSSNSEMVIPAFFPFKNSQNALKSLEKFFIFAQWRLEMKFNFD